MRDVYDIVNISRNFGDKIDFEQVRTIAKEKFKFKKLVELSVSELMKVVDTQVLRVNWEHQLSHQLVVLPDVEVYLQDLKGVVGKWLEDR